MQCRVRGNIALRLRATSLQHVCMHVHLLLCGPTVMNEGQVLVVSFGEVALTEFEPLKLLMDVIMQN